MRKLANRFNKAFFNYRFGGILIRRTSSFPMQQEQSTTLKIVVLAFLTLACGLPGQVQPRTLRDVAPQRRTVVVQNPRAGAKVASAFFPLAVWYSGGKARAPMLEKITPESQGLWKDDLLKIKDLGFNSVRTWVEWNVAE